MCGQPFPEIANSGWMLLILFLSKVKVQQREQVTMHFKIALDDLLVHILSRRINFTICMYMDYPFGKFVTEFFSIMEVARTLIRGLMLDVYVATFSFFSWSLQAEGHEETFKGFHFS